MPLRIARGPPLDVREESIAAMLFARVARHRQGVAWQLRDPDGTFRDMTWGELGDAVSEVAAGFARIGLRPGERVAILADTRPEWSLADFGAQAAAGAVVTVYPTLPADQVEDLLRDSGASFLVVDSPAQQEKVAPFLAATGVRRIVTLGAIDAALGEQAKRALTFDALRAEGRAALEADPTLVQRRVAEVRGEDLSTIIYTSGTTGIPKGAALSHANWLAASRSLIQAFKLEMYEDRRSIVFLPLAHVLSRIMLVVFTDLGGTLAWSSPKTVAQDLPRVRPRALVCVPRIWERMHSQIHKQVAQMPAHKRAVFARAEKVARAYGHATANGRSASLALRAEHALHERLVYRTLRKRLGFDDLIGALSSAAAIRADLLAFYWGIGVPIAELWGMTEMAGPGTTNTLDRYKPGTVGWPIPGVDVALDDDGEVCVAGPNVFDGYHARPEENAALFFEADGCRWFRTGDVGRFDEDGALCIIDRKKEIEVLDTGKKLAPVAIEERLKTVSPLVAEACVVAHGRKYAGCLVQADFDRLVAWARERSVPFDESRIVVRPDPTGAPMTYGVGEDLLAHPEVHGLFTQEVERCNAHGADYERIRAFHLVPHVFSQDRDELTMTLKKKRRVILAHYAAEVERMFARARG